MNSYRKTLSPVGLMAIFGLLLLGGGIEIAEAQYAVDNRVDMRLPSAGPVPRINPAPYPAGQSYIRPQSPLIGGNAFATGNVAGGLSLRSYSPISDPMAFRAPLGSTDLSTFRRDSVSPLTYLQGVNRDTFIQPYHDPTRTTFTSGYVHGLAGFGPQTPRGGRGRLDTRQSLMITPETPQQALSSFGPQSLPDATMGGPTTSSIFGTENLAYMRPDQVPNVQVQRGLDALAAQMRDGQQQVGQLPGFPEQRTRRSFAERLAAQRPADRLTGQLDAMSPLERVLGGQTQETLDQPIGLAGISGPWQGGWQDGEFRSGWIIRERADDAGDLDDLTDGLAPRPEDIDPSVLPGYDVYTDMRLALALEQSTHAEWFAEMRAAAMSHPELADDSTDAAIADAEGFREGMLNSPLRTFTGGGASALNDLMLKAESLMDIGHYFEAADRYRAAAALDPTNPLPAIGRGHALLAGGQYRSAVHALLRGLELFPDFARFSIDLKALLGGGEEVDIRRADLLRRLDQGEQAELRFLLGYLEYHSGQVERGMRNLRRAAELARPGSLIGRYPDMLQGVTPLPLPRLEGAIEPSEEVAEEEAAVNEESAEERLVVPPRE